MRLLACLSVLLLALALAEAVPAPKSIEKKSLIEDSKLEKKASLKIDEEGKEKDRAKKSAASFIVEIKPTATQASPDCKDGSSQVQTVSVVPASQPSAQLQTLNVVPAPQPQLQTVSVVPSAQPAPLTSSSLVIPAQPAVQPVHTLHILQSVPQPCAQPAQVSFVQTSQPAPQPQTLNIIQTPAPPKPAPKPEPKPTPAPEPAPQPERIVEIVKPEPQHPKPSQVVNIIQPAQPVPEPTETVSILPMEQECEEQVVVMPQTPMYVMAEPEPQPQLATLVQMPTSPCYHQQQALFTECNCHPKNLAYVSSASPSAPTASTVVKDRHTGPSFKTFHHLAHHHHAPAAAPPMPVYVYSTTFAQPMMSAPVSVPAAAEKPPSYMIQYNPVQSPVSLGRSASHELVGEGQKGQARTSTTINLGGGLPTGHFHGHNTYAMKGYGGLPHGITINTHPHHYGGSVSPWYRQSAGAMGAQYPGVTIQEGDMNSPGASEAMDMIQAMSSKKVPRETDQNILAAEEADKNIKEIIEASSPRTARSDSEAKVEKTEESDASQ